MNAICKGLMCLLLLSGAQALAASPVHTDPPADSIYRITPLYLRDQNGIRFALAGMRGRPLVVGMFYASCQAVCPVEIETLKRLQRALPQPLAVC